MALSRRSFLAGGVVALAGAAGWRALASEPSNAGRAPKGRFGPLVADPAGVLDLPEGFSYRVLERRGAPMSDGYLVPALPDGMGCFTTADGNLALHFLACRVHLHSGICHPLGFKTPQPQWCEWLMRRGEVHMNIHVI